MIYAYGVLWALLLLVGGNGSSASMDKGLNTERLEYVQSGTQWAGFTKITRDGGKFLKSSPGDEDHAELVALQNGTICFEDKISGGIIWSFSSGSPLYSFYQTLAEHIGDKENASFSRAASSIDHGDEQELYGHGKHSGILKHPFNVEDLMKHMPYISEDGTITIGSTKTTVFKVAASTGTLIHTYKGGDSTSALASASASALLDDEHKFLNDSGKKSMMLSDPVDPHGIMYITRTDHHFQTFGPNSEKSSWSQEIAVIEAVFLCNLSESTTAWNPNHAIGSEIHSYISRYLRCQSRRMIVRIQDQPSSSANAYANGLLSLPASDENPRSHGHDDRLANGRHGEMVLTSPALKLPLALPGGDHGALVMQDDAILYMSNWPAWAPVLSFVIIFVGFVLSYKSLVGRETAPWKRRSPSEGSKASSSRRKKSRKLNNSSANPKANTMTATESEGRVAVKKGSEEALLSSKRVMEGGPEGRRIGKLVVSNEVIAMGSNGTIVLEGTYDGRTVAVKRLVQAHQDVAIKEIQNLIASDRHPNIVRWHGVEYDKDFVYLSLERCTCSLDDLIQIYSDSSIDPLLCNDDLSARDMIPHKQQLGILKGVIPDLTLWKANGHPSSVLLSLMRDLVHGLVHLHELGIIHRDLKPQNVLIVKEKFLCAKLSDMGISKRVVGDASSLGCHATGCGSSGWQAPEQLLHGRQTRAVDLFSLGCVLYFCITGGRHPFGNHLERDVNIVKNQADLFLSEHIPEAGDLISRLLNPDPDLRPKAVEVASHPMFWSSDTRLRFLRDASDRVEGEERESHLLKALERTAAAALGGKWNEKMEPGFVTNIGQYRRYKFGSVRDLLRVMRNKLSHYRELPTEIQEMVGSVPDGFERYFATRFPRLLIEVYTVMLNCCGEEEDFQKYFKGPSL